MGTSILPTSIMTQRRKPNPVVFTEIFTSTTRPIHPIPTTTPPRPVAVHARPAASAQ